MSSLPPDEPAFLKNLPEFDGPPPQGIPPFMWEHLRLQARCGNKIAEFCLRHGRSWTLPEQGISEAVDARKECFANAGSRALDADMEDPDNPQWLYVEGYACLKDLEFPIHHAWLVNPAGEIWDTTWANGAFYLGCVVQPKALSEVIQSKARWGFFDWGTPRWVADDVQRWLAPGSRQVFHEMPMAPEFVFCIDAANEGRGLSLRLLKKDTGEAKDFYQAVGNAASMKRHFMSLTSAQCADWMRRQGKPQSK